MKREEIEAEMQLVRDTFHESVALERCGQIRQWGRDSHDPEFWICLISKHLGILAAHAIECREIDYYNKPEEAEKVIDKMAHRRKVIAALITAWEEQVWTRHLGLEKGEEET